MKARRIVVLLLLVSCVTIIGGGNGEELPIQQDCIIEESMPIGRVNQGGYDFNYQSLIGEECRLYRLQNNPGSVSTPVIWKDEQETFLDVILPKCPSGSTDPPWKPVIRITTGPLTKGETTIAYGVNRDEYEEKPDAYRKKMEQYMKFSPRITIIRGIVADAQEKPIEIAIRVSSYVDGSKPYRLTYEIAITGKSEAFQILRRPVIVPEDPSVLGLIWESPASKPFFEHLDQMRIKKLSAEMDNIVINFEAKEIELEEFKLLFVVQGTKRIVATTAPAYKPKD